MWYVIQVEKNQEESMREQVDAALEGVCPCELFVPKYACKWKRAGEWLLITRVLFPSYIFLDFEGEQDEKCKQAVLKRLQVFTSHKVVPVCIGGGFYPIRPEEPSFLSSLMNERYEIESSVGDIVGGKLIVKTGPLLNHTHLVTFIDRHKCIAELRTSLWGDERTMKVGLEVVNKTA